jgi:hypothetical protein
MRLHGCLVAAMTTISAVPALAADPDDATRCPWLVSAMDRDDTGQITATRGYLTGVFQRKDAEHMLRGEPGLMLRLSEDDVVNLLVAAVERCRKNTSYTVARAGTDVYEAARAWVGMAGATGRQRGSR